MAGKSLIGALRVTLGLDSAQFTAGTAKARKEMTGLQKGASLVKGAMAGMFAAIGVDTFVRLAKQGLDYASSLGETAKQLGVSTRALQEYRYAATQVGLSQEEMDKALEMGTKRMVAQEETYKKLGISARDAAGNFRDIGDLMPEIADAMQKLHSPAERASYLTDLFGKSGSRLAPLMESGASGVNSLRAAATEMGLVLDDKLIEGADAAADRLAAVKQILEMKLASTVAANVGEINDLADALMRLPNAINDAMRWWKRFELGADRFDILTEGIGTSSWSSRMRRMGEKTYQIDMLSDEGQARLRQRGADLLSGKRIGDVGVNPGLLRPTSTIAPRASGTGVQFDKRFLPSTPSLLQRSNAVRALNLGGTDYSQFAPAGRNADAELRSGEALVAALNARSDAAMKAARMAYPALQAATGKLTDQESELRGALQGVLDRLFPDAAEARQFRSELVLLAEAHNAGTLTAEDHARAIEALRREYLGLGQDSISAGELVLGGDSDDLEQAAARAGDVSSIVADHFGKIGETAKVQRVEVVQNFAQMVDGALRETDRLIRGFKSGNVLDIVGGFLNTVNSIAGLFNGGAGISGLFGGGGAGGSKVTNIPGYATGGAMRLGGLPGMDRNMLSLNGKPLARVSSGETMTITPANDRGGAGGTTIVQNYYGPGADEFWGKIARGNAEAAVAGARGGASLARSQMMRMQGRQLA